MQRAAGHIPTCAQEDAGEDGAGDGGDGGATNVLLGEVQVVTAVGKGGGRREGMQVNTRALQGWLGGERQG
jgi:hypothetical protein